jgi:phosphoglycolate phosphatase
MSYKAIIFDLDGTLLDTLGDLADAMNLVLERNGHPAHPKEDYNYFVGEGVINLVRRTLPEDSRDEETIQRVVKEFKDEYSRRWDATTRPFEGVSEMLDILKQRGITTAVLSNKPHEYTIKCVERFLPPDAIDITQGVNDECPPKPDPTGSKRMVEELGIAPEEVVYLGDTNTDMETALKAGFLPVGVLWGFRSREELEEAGAEKILDHPSEIPGLI